MFHPIRHLVMVSLDAVSDRDAGLLKTLPHFAELCRMGTLFRQVSSVFVSNTYPAHSSIITGCLPRRHGLIENVRTQPGRVDPDWRVQAAELRVPTLYGRAAMAGLSTCSVFYPVTCGAAGIRWNLPEVPGRMSLLKRAGLMFGGGTPSFILSAVPKAGSVLFRHREPELDGFLLRVAVSALRSKRPNLLLLHLIDVDSQKHRYGPDSREARDALRRHDERLGRLTAVLRAEFPPEDTAVIVFSDHGCRPVRSAVDPNRWLESRGFIRGGRYDAFFHNAGGSSFLKLLRPERRSELLSAVPALLASEGVGRRLSEQEMAESGMAGEFLLGIEAADGYAFGKFERGQHGYSLRHADYQAFYLAAGGPVPRGGQRAGGCITDICPLAATLLGLPLWPMDGVCRLELTPVRRSGN